jgi:nucleotide-binding universal stress UspA family protein
MTRVIVGVDGSETAQAALAWADREAVLHGWPIDAVMAWGLLAQQHEDPATPFDPTYGETEARAALGAFVDRAVGAARAPAIGRRPVCALPAPALLEAGEEAALLVVGSRGRGGFKGMLLGSVSQQVLHHTPVPLAIVRPLQDRSTDADEQIIVGVDGSPASHDALRWAVAEAALRKARLTVVHAWHMPNAGGYPYIGVGFEPAPFEEAAREAIDAGLATVDTSVLAHPVERVTFVGGGAEGILTQAKDADLVVVGTRGRGGFSGLLLGSVSHQVARHARCPVVVVPPAQ